jgi:hypothetical protein
MVIVLPGYNFIGTHNPEWDSMWHWVSLQPQTKLTPSNAKLHLEIHVSEKLINRWIKSRAMSSITDAQFAKPCSKNKVAMPMFEVHQNSTIKIPKLKTTSIHGLTILDTYLHLKTKTTQT